MAAITKKKRHVKKNSPAFLATHPAIKMGSEIPKWKVILIPMPIDELQLLGMSMTTDGNFQQVKKNN
jgi:hypothetical protein